MYREKYLKYKSKYLDLKNQVSFAQGGSIKQKYLDLKNQVSFAQKNNSRYITHHQYGGKGEIVQVIPNTGAIEGMTNQCMWISVYDYIIRRPAGSPPLPRANPGSVRALRADAGLNASTENTPFDSDNQEFRKALHDLAVLYGLRIEVFPVDSSGTVLYDVIQIINPGGANLVRIAQYGLNHFQLIVSGLDGVIIPGGSVFQGAIFNKGHLTLTGNAKLQSTYDAVVAGYNVKLQKIRDEKKIHEDEMEKIKTLIKNKYDELEASNDNILTVKLFGEINDLDAAYMSHDSNLARLESERQHNLDQVQIDADHAVAISLSEA